jgi:RHS repeat-associated protein
VKVYASNIDYAPHGAPAAMQLVSGRWENRTYNNRLQLTHFGAGTSATDSSWGSYSYDYGTTNNNGNVHSHHIVGPNGIDITQTFQYDSLNRITSFTEPVVSENYAYDRYGNRAVTSSMNMPTYNVRSLSDFNTANNRIKQQPYDAAGNWMEYGFTYDAENRPAGSTSGLDILYNGHGYRVFADSLLQVPNIFDQLTAVYWKENEWWPFSISYARDQTADALGSLRIESPAPGPGNGIGRDDYSPFGATIVEPTFTPYRSPNRDSTGSLWAMGQGFLGKRASWLGGPDGWHLGAREYSGLYGRFVSPDAPFADQHPEDPQSWNLYSYGRNNPLINTDPTGRCSQGPDDKMHDDDDGKCADVTSITVSEKAEDVSPISQLLFGVVYGHHGLSEWSKIPRGTIAYRFFSQWYTGRLQAPTANYYDALHRLLNQANRRIVDNFLQEIGKSLSGLTKQEVKVLAQRLLNSNDPGVQQFLSRLERLNPGSVGRLASLINGIKFGSGFVFLVPGQEQLLNYQRCGQSTCGSRELY